MVPSWSTAKEWNSYYFPSFIATFFMFCFTVIIISLFISINTRSISKTMEGELPQSAELQLGA